MTSTTVKRAYKYRFYPTPEQASELARTFGCVRFVWNRVLDQRTRRYRTESVSTSYADSDKMLTALKRDRQTLFLNEVSSVPLQQTLRHQHKALTAFFDGRARYPRFKRRHRGKDAATYTSRGFRLRDGELFLAKMSQPLQISWSRELPVGAEPTSVTISRDAADRFFVSVLVEETVEHLPTAANEAVGVDLGVATWAVTSAGEQISAPQHFRARQQRVIRAQKKLSKRAKGSTRRHRARQRLARAHAKLADAREDFLHQESTRIIRENQAVILEDLAVQAMTTSAKGTVESPGRRVKQKAGLNREILNGSFGRFRSMIEYKAHLYGRDVVIADRFFPSSKTCSSCGYLLDTLDLTTRSWSCPGCGATHDRDHNAAKNLADFALGLREKQNARGGPVRPLA